MLILIGTAGAGRVPFSVLLARSRLAVPPPQKVQVAAKSPTPRRKAATPVKTLGGLFYTTKHREVTVVAKSKYDSLVAPRLDEIKDWCRNGATDLEVYTRLGVGKDAFYDYKKKFPEFAEVLKHSKEYCDGQIENALFEAAKAGNVTAQIFWLKNRRSKVWREKPEENDGDKADGGVHININIADCKGGDGNGGE